MRHTKCLYSSSRALQRVFLADFAPGSSSSSSRSAISSPAPWISVLQPGRVRPAALPHTTRMPGLPPTTTTTRGYAKRKKPPKFEPRKYTENHAIPYDYVRLASPVDGSLMPPQRKLAVLSSLDLRTHSLRMVAHPPHFYTRAGEEGEEGEDGAAAKEEEEEEEEGGPELEAAIVRIIDRAADAAAQAELKLEMRRRQVNTKVLELNWATDPHDLGHKFRRLRDFLGRGMRVEVLLERRRGGRAVSRAEAHDLLAKLREAVAEVPGTKEPVKPDGQVGGMLRLVFEGPADKQKKKRKSRYAKEGEEGEEEEGAEEGAER
ncbi:hypothetical protein F4780DRAFT_775909 [Xylariomycetidae sp. FL0641]|nr:hypothetical protein F4780DRAFT_775909 [Xylariomycetidae sp. FL0641]